MGKSTSFPDMRTTSGSKPHSQGITGVNALSSVALNMPTCGCWLSPRMQATTTLGWKHSGSPVSEPADPDAMAGEQIFIQGACSMCHTVRGTIAGGRVAPDLTHIGSR